MAIQRFLMGLLSLGVLALPAKDTSTCANLWGQCGGETWTGPYCCTAGSTCKVQNRWYSQCLATTATSDGPLEYSLADERSFHELSYKWSIAWDRKDKSTWLAITAPQVVADYADYPAVGTVTIASPDDIFTHSFTVTGLGDKRLGTQHFLGASFFTRTNATEHAAQWDSSAFVEFLYVVVDGHWKIGGIRPHTVVATTGRPEDIIGSF
ncbi:hypothetical protein BN1723_009309 [Verticillium longisporum]|uniref:CBM1 domain-containing protein n=1 Tax=Verticillium longisporum TaxID=100787 RepID=A0A0G4KP05_VERLO|nr:1 like protein [Verticillium longisporum]CRK11175.1 hypothetical protein BN1723_009309 [Verticillium longisporum]